MRSPWARRSVTTFSPRAAAASYWSLALLAMTRPSLSTLGREVLGPRDEALGVLVASFWSSSVRAWRSAMPLLEVLLHLVRLLLGALAQVDALGLLARDLELLTGVRDRVDRDVRGADDGVERGRVDLDVGQPVVDLAQLAAHVGDGGLGLLLGVLDGLGDLLLLSAISVLLLVELGGHAAVVLRDWRRRVLAACAVRGGGVVSGVVSSSPTNDR